MKNFICISLFFLSITAFSQDYLDKIAIQTCDCFSKVPDTLSSDETNMKFGFCMIAASDPYKKQIKKDYNINLDAMDGPTGERLGRLLGIKIAGQCPDAIVRLQGKTAQKVEQPTSAGTTNTFTGVITKIETNGFVTFTVKDEMGKTTAFYWLEFIQCDKDLPGIYNTLSGKLVTITYKTSDYFEPKINQYRQYFCITKLQIVGN